MLYYAEKITRRCIMVTNKGQGVGTQAGAGRLLYRVVW
jgi:hypothetical protein